MSAIGPLPVRRSLAFVATALVLIGLNSGCGSRLEPLPFEPQALPAQVTLAPGQSASFGAEGALRVTFREIEADSRCPVDAQCVWAGDAAVLLRLERAGLRAGTTLHTTLQPQRLVFDDDFAIRLVSVSPAPRATSQIPGDQYRVTLEVTSP